MADVGVCKAWEDVFVGIQIVIELLTDEVVYQNIAMKWR